MAGPGAKGGMWSRKSNGQRVLVTKSMARQMAAAGMSAQSDEKYAEQAAKLREQNNAEAKAKRKADVEKRTIRETRYSVPTTSALVPVTRPSPNKASKKTPQSGQEWVNPNPIKTKDLKGEIKEYFKKEYNPLDKKINSLSDLNKLKAYQVLKKNIETQTGETFSLRNRDHLERLYRKNIGILPGEDKETGPKTSNGINVMKYFRPYQAFGINTNASNEEKYDAYKKWSKKYHPDNPKTGDREMFERGEVMYRSIAMDITTGKVERRTRTKTKKKKKKA